MNTPLIAVDDEKRERTSPPCLYPFPFHSLLRGFFGRDRDHGETTREARGCSSRKKKEKKKKERPCGAPRKRGGEKTAARVFFLSLSLLHTPERARRRKCFIMHPWCYAVKRPSSQAYDTSVCNIDRHMRQGI